MDRTITACPPNQMIKSFRTKRERTLAALLDELQFRLEQRAELDLLIASLRAQVAELNGGDSDLRSETSAA